MNLLFSILLFLNIGGNQQVTPKMLFYIERNLNKNIVVYEANFDENGQLNSKKPINVFWLLNEDEGQKENLNYAERKLAYGVKYSPASSSNNSFEVELVADKSRKIILKQLAPFKAAIYTTINSKWTRLKQMFIQADNGSFFPKVKYIQLKSENGDTERYIPEE